MTDRVPRPLRPVEAAVVGRLLTDDFDGAAALRVQLDSALAFRGCDCGCPTIDLVVQGDPPQAPRYPLGLAPAEGLVSRPGALGDQILLFVRDGRLDRLEYAYDDKAPTEWPEPDQIQVVRDITAGRPISARRIWHSRT